ncbi:MAG: TIGR00159 family protein [Burkholderiales bacterium]|nr:TIGR00159 family protein [Anaerolineae bacterium]
MELAWAISNLTPTAIVDILLVAMLFFGASFFIRGTQAVVLLRGMVIVLAGMVVVSNVFQLLALRWLLGNALTVLAVAIPVIFQPELRRALERLGRAGVLLNNRRPPETLRAKVIEDICQAAEKLSERRHGALIVLERNSSLQEYIRTGIPLDSEVSSQILLTVFWPKTELHDGAAIISGNGRIASAASVLPLTASRNLPDRKLGTRHRAALGISEVSDAICVVVSEETGKIAITDGGRMIPRLDPKRLRTILNALYNPERKPSIPMWARVREWADEIRNRLRPERNQA